MTENNNENLRRLSEKESKVRDAASLFVLENGLYPDTIDIAEYCEMPVHEVYAICEDLYYKGFFNRVGEKRYDGGFTLHKVVDADV